MPMIIVFVCDLYYMCWRTRIQPYAGMYTDVVWYAYNILQHIIYNSVKTLN